MPIPKAPRGLKTSGRRLWASVTEVYELEPHEERLLLEMARTADALDALAAVVEAEGPLLDGRAHPGLVEARQLRITYARLSAALRLPAGDEDDRQRGARGQRSERRPQRRVGARGVYGIRGGVA